MWWFKPLSYVRLCSNLLTGLLAFTLDFISIFHTTSWEINLKTKSKLLLCSTSSSVFSFHRVKSKVLARPPKTSFWSCLQIHSHSSPPSLVSSPFLRQLARLLSEAVVIAFLPVWEVLPAGLKWLTFSFLYITTFFIFPGRTFLTPLCEITCSPCHLTVSFIPALFFCIACFIA